METTSTSVTTTAGTDITYQAPDVASLYESAGNPDAETVLVFAQGGPTTQLDSNGFSLLIDGLDLDELFVVNLEPRTMMGEVSEGMLFDIGYADGLLPATAQPERNIPNGARAG